MDLLEMLRATVRPEYSTPIVSIARADLTVLLDVAEAARAYREARRAQGKVIPAGLSVALEALEREA